MNGHAASLPRDKSLEWLPAGGSGNVSAEGPWRTGEPSLWERSALDSLKYPSKRLLLLTRASASVPALPPLVGRNESQTAH